MTVDEEPLACVRRAVWGILYADDAGIVSKSEEGLAITTTVIVAVFDAAGLTVSEKKTEIMLLQTQDLAARVPPFTTEAARHRYKQTTKFLCPGGVIHEDADRTVEIERRARVMMACYERFGPDLYDRPTAPLNLEVRMLKAEAIETLLYGCVTWTLNKSPYHRLRKAHLEVLRRVLGFQRRPDHTSLSYAKGPKKTKCESIEATIRKQRLFFAGAMVRRNTERIPSRLMFAQIMRGEDRSPGEQPKDSFKTLRDDLAAFRSAEGSTADSPRTFGVETAMWFHAAKQAGEWQRAVPEASERFMVRWHLEEAPK